MKLKKGIINLGKAPNAMGIYNNGIVTVYYHNGSGISVKKADINAKTATDGKSTDMYYDWAVETPLRAVALKGRDITTW